MHAKNIFCDCLIMNAFKMEVLFKNLMSNSTVYLVCLINLCVVFDYFVSVSIIYVC